MIRTWVYDRIHCKWVLKMLTPAQNVALPHVTKSAVALAFACGSIVTVVPPPPPAYAVPPPPALHTPPPPPPVPWLPPVSPPWGFTPPPPGTFTYTPPTWSPPEQPALDTSYGGGASGAGGWASTGGGSQQFETTPPLSHETVQELCDTPPHVTPPAPIPDVPVTPAAPVGEPGTILIFGLGAVLMMVILYRSKPLEPSVQVVILTEEER